MIYQEPAEDAGKEEALNAFRKLTVELSAYDNIHKSLTTIYFPQIHIISMVKQYMLLINEKGGFPQEVANRMLIDYHLYLLENFTTKQE